MKKILVTVLALTLSGCYIYPTTITEAERFCSTHGGVKYIFSNSWTDQETITCKEEYVQKVIKDQHK